MSAGGQLEDSKRHLHFPEGYLRSSGGKHRACCHCGWVTTPRVSRDRARQALLDEHGFTGKNDKRPAECGICGATSRWWAGYPWPWETFKALADPAGGEFYVCRDDQACHARYGANRRADQLKCGCYQSSVMAIGHYHEVGSMPAGR